MYHDNYKVNEPKYDEYVARGIYTINPTLSSLQEIILLYLKELSFYLLKLKEFGISNEKIKENLIEILSGIITNTDYNQEQFQDVITTAADYLTQAKTLYFQYCKDHDIEAEFIKTFFKHGKKLTLADAIKKGEKYFLQKNTQCAKEKKSLFDIILFLAKSMCIRIIQLKNLKKDYDFAYLSMLSLLNTMNFDDMPTEKIKEKIDAFIGDYYKLVQKIFEAQEEVYGKRSSIQVAFSTRPGKAILFSGVDLTELEDLLKATKGKGIDVYTHGIEAMGAHTLEKFREYPHLAGHFGKGVDNCLLDFAAFPGAILTTKHFFQKLEYVYRGRLFTTDFITPHGVAKINNRDFEPIIKSALDAKGFVKKQPIVNLRVGFRQDVLEEKAAEIILKMRKGEIRHLYIVGLLNDSRENKEYFEKFFELLPKDCYALSLAYDKCEENIFNVDSFFDYLLIYKILERFNEEIPLAKMKLSVFVTKCDQHTVANLINFKNMGLRDVYMCKCQPTLVNPALMEALRDIFGIKEFSDPKEDIAATLAVDKEE